MSWDVANAVCQFTRVLSMLFMVSMIKTIFMVILEWYSPPMSSEFIFLVLNKVGQKYDVLALLIFSKTF